MPNPQLEREFIDKRINIVFGIIIAVFVIFFVGFWYLQVIRGPYYDVLAKENILKDYPIPAPRGLIVDRTNEILAENRLSHNLFVTPRIAQNLDHTLDFLSSVLGLTHDELKKMILKEGNMHSARPVLVYRDLSLSQLAYVSARKVEYPELDIKQETKRSYRYDSLFAHALGYVGEITEQQQKANEFPRSQEGDTVGQAGLERYYNAYLRGEDGYERKYVNSSGVELKELLPDKKPAVPGKVLRLGLDLDMQKAADAAFNEMDESGAAVAMDIKTGEILMLYNKPYYNPNDFIPRIAPTKWKDLISDPGHPLQNVVVQNKFSPGSTFKIIMALAALQEKKITPDTSFFCGGSQYIYNRTFRCWKPGGHGTVNLHNAITQSCDVYFYNVGMRLDIDTIAKYARLLGLGDLTNIDMPGETRGLVPDRAWKMKAAHDKWYPGETISVAIGQGPILVTALQMANMVATVAKDGVRVKPRMLGSVLDMSGKTIEKPQPDFGRVTGIDEKNYEFVKQALWGVVNGGGTGGKARVDGYDICGKTGTVQIVGYDRGEHLSTSNKSQFGYHAWFVSFSPLNDPKIAMAVLVEHGGHGADAAAPVAKKIYEAYFQSHHIPPSSTVKAIPPRLSEEEESQAR